MVVEWHRDESGSAGVLQERYPEGTGAERGSVVQQSRSVSQ